MSVRGEPAAPASASPPSPTEASWTALTRPNIPCRLRAVSGVSLMSHPLWVSPPPVASCPERRRLGSRRGQAPPARVYALSLPQADASGPVEVVGASTASLAMRLVLIGRGMTVDTEVRGAMLKVF